MILSYSTFSLFELKWDAALLNTIMLNGIII